MTVGPPPPDSSATCSLVTSASVLDVSLQWSSSFNSQYAVERYRVSVDPDPSCSSNQVVPSEDYSCPGLDLDRNYSITVSAINCGDQEGESDIFTVLPQLLGTYIVLYAQGLKRGKEIYKGGKGFVLGLMYNLRYKSK